MSSGTFDAYLLAQALGWEWNLTSFLILEVAPIVFIIIVALFCILTDR